MPKTMSINLLNNVNSPLKLNSPINMYVENSCSKSVLNKQPMMEYWGYTCKPLVSEAAACRCFSK